MKGNKSCRVSFISNFLSFFLNSILFCVRPSICLHLHSYYTDGLSVFIYFKQTYKGTQAYLYTVQKTMSGHLYKHTTRIQNIHIFDPTKATQTANTDQ